MVVAPAIICFSLKSVLTMDMEYYHCCGLDDQKRSFTTHAISPKGKEIETFGI
jgi:hypothetical protein